MTEEVEPGKAKAAGIVGILIGCCALANLVCGFICVALGEPSGTGIWTGFGHLIIAICGVVTWLKLNKGAFIAFLVFNILWLIVSIVGVVICLIGWLVWHVIGKVVDSECDTVGDVCICRDGNEVPFPVSDCDDIGMIETSFMVMVIINAICAILCFAGSIIGCMGTCCAKQETTNVVVVQQPGMVMTQSNMPPPEYPPK